MIHVGSRDGRKRLGSGLEMAETELEEGEAFSYHDEEEDSTIDPDIALSYIEEKLQNVLGHFQKDFEGGVSAENLGAKYGGYGSFLPAYQRSPSWSHTKSPAEGHNYASPRKTLLEDQRQNALSALSSASPLAKSRPGPGKAVSVSRHAEESSLKTEVNKKPANSSDQRTLKVRIRVGSENLPTQKNAEIYSGLGLEVSPSSSLDDSPTTSGGRYGKFLNVPEESPTSILQIMTSYPREILLSPLSEDLIHLTEKKKLRGKWETKSFNKTSLESSGMLPNGSLSSRRNQKDPDQKKLKSSDKDDVFSTELTDKRNSSHKDNPVPLSKKEKENDIDSLVCEELVSSALRLPLLSSSEHNVADHAPSNSSFFEKEHLDGEYAQETGRAEMSSEKLSSSGKFPESKKGNLVGSAAEKSHSLDQSESNVSKGRKFLTSEPNDPTKLLDPRKVGSVNEEGPSKSAHEKSSSSKRKQKVAKDELAVESTLTPKTGKISLTHNSIVSKNDSRSLQKDNGKPLDRYKDFFGDVEFDDDDNESISGEMTSTERVKDPQLVGKRSLSEDHKEKCNSKIPEKPLPAPRPASHLAPPGNGPSSEAPIGSVPLLNEDWVSCDKCQKWRLLPLGTNPKSLPDKWLCRMLTWLPGMNRCSVPEEETTNALRALYHPGPAPASVAAPVSETQPIKINNSVANSVGIASVDARYPGPEQQSVSVQTATNSGKKKHGSTKAANSTELDGSTHSSNSKKKHLLNSGKISNLNSEDFSPSVDASLRKSNDAVEKYNDNKKEKVSAVNSSDKGMSLKIKSKRDADMEGSRSSKRMRSEEMQLNDDNCASDNGETSSKAGRASTSNNTSGNDRGRKYNKQKDLRGEVKKNIVSDDGLLHSEKVDDKEAGKKRKAKDETCESDHRKEKKARVSKSGGKDKSGSKASLGEDRKSRSTKDQHNNEKEDYMKSEMGPIQLSVAANSSSSKVSGSHKNKTNGQEVKGSPVESVSSSPLRFPNADKVASVRKNVDGSNDRKGMVKKEDDPRVKHSLEQSKVQEKINAEQKSQNSGKKSSHSKEKGRPSGLEIDKVNIKASDSVDHDHMYEEKSKSRRNKSEDKKPSTPSNGENFISKKDIAGGTSSESNKGQSQKKFEDPIKSHDKKYNLQQEHENEKLPKKSNQGEIHDSGKSHSLPPLARNQNESVSSQKENGFDNGDALKAPNQRKKAESSNGQLLRHPTPNTHRVRDVEAPSPVRRDSSSHAANNALKEAKDLKHLADRLKNSGSSDSIGFYFQASLKFLHGASLLESGSNEATKHNDLMHSMHIYKTTAKLCEFCAHEYEKSKDMAAAALAYKCVEVAYLRVVYSSHASASRDRNELQRALQIVPPGESPSSSASDVDNLNHQATTEKAALPKVVGSPQVSGSHIITSRQRAGLLHVINFAQDVNFAMEASRKSRNAFTAATSRLGETSHKEGISQLKKALDFNFQDVEGLLRLVRIATEAINR